MAKTFGLRCRTGMRRRKKLYSEDGRTRGTCKSRRRKEGNAIFVLLNPRETEKEYKIWDGFRDVEAISYSMKPDYHDPQMDEEFFPEEADGVIMLLNTEKLSKRSDALGDIFSDLLVPGNVELKNKDMEKRRKEVFTEEEVRKMCYEEQKMHERLMEPFKIKSIKYMHSLGASAEDISKKTDEPLEKVKKILETK